MDKYLHAQSHHHIAQKYAFLKTLVSIIVRILAPHHLNKEKAHFTKVLQAKWLFYLPNQQAFHEALLSKTKTKDPLSTLST
jgi:hypothetical protein